MGVPQLLVRYVVDGGINRQSTVGAVPYVVNGEAVSVPPEMFVLWPAPALELLFQVVTSVNVVAARFLAAVTITVSLVYGLTVSLSWNMVVAAAPAVSAYQPVAVDSVVCVPPVPPVLVVPVNEVPARDLDAAIPETFKVPTLPMNVFQSASLSVPVDDLFMVK